MKRIYALLFNLTLISTNSMANPSKVDNKYKSNKDSASLSQHTTKNIKYTIKSGDTLLAIARKYYTTRDDIRSLNSLKKGETLSIGRILKIPVNTYYPSGSILKYSIKSGDTLLAIAQKYHSTTAEICKINKISKTTQLKLGQILKVPINSTISQKDTIKHSKSKTKIKTINYKIKSGDTILGIARKYYSTTKEIIKLNKIGKKENLKLGRVLKIPLNTFYPKNRVDDYIVNEGDTLTSVANKFGILEDKLFLMNNLDSKNISKGIVLKVPKSKKSSKTITKKEEEKKSNLTIASVVKDGKDKEYRLKKEREAKEKEAMLRLAIAQREVEEEAILAKAEEIRKAREIREEGLRKAKLAREKAEREEQARLARIAKQEAEERERVRQAKLKAEKEAREKIRLAKMKEATLERERLAKIEKEETKKLLEAKAEAKKAIDLANKREEEQRKLELAKKRAEDKVNEAKKRVEALEKAVRERALKVKKQEEEIQKIKSKKESSINIDRYKSIAKKERIQAKKIARVKKVKDKKIKIMPIKNSNDPSILTTKKSKIVDYTVKKGDNLYKIAKAHHTTTKEVLQSNHFRSNSDLVIGKMIKVPVDTYFHLKNYTIKKGDTLYKIARKHNTTTTRVLLANNMRRGTKLHKGNIIKVPVDTFSLQKDIRIASNGKKKISKKKFKKLVVSKKLMHHKVKRGDTIYSIAKRNNITVKSLKLANKLKSNRDLKIGQNLTLPASNKKSIGIKIAKKSKKVKKSKNRIVLNARTGRSLDSLMRSLSSSNKRKALPKLARKHLGKRYVWGAKGPYKFDCSGFTSYVCKKNGVDIPRTSLSQSKVGQYISRSNLKAGDLIFFDTSKRRKGYVNHVGIYIGNNKFIHASSAKRRVVVTSLNKPFYKSRFKWGRRM